MNLRVHVRPGPRPYLDARNRELQALRFEHIQPRRLGPSIGAEIGGVDLAQLDDATFEELRRALFAYRVIFFRDQDLSVQAHRSFAERFGELEDHPFIPAKDGNPDVIRFQKSEEVVGVENIWHSDVSWREVPSLGSVLRAVEVPPIGGDTLFSDMVAAYECLDDEVKERIDGLHAVHDFSHSFGLMLTPEQLEEKRRQFPPARHPVVRTNPETGTKSIYVNPIFTSHIEGVSAEESDELLDLLYAQAWVPEYQVRFHWEKNSVAFWDNRQVQHYAANDYWPSPRVMERITIIGERPR